MTDSSLFAPELLALIPDQEERNQIIKDQGDAVPAPGTISPEVMRRFRVYDKNGEIKLKLSPTARTEPLKLNDRTIEVRIFDVDDPKAVLVHFHGGGWIMGSLYEQERYLTKMSEESGVRIVSVDYPLAPEAQLPEILDVAYDAVCSIADSAPDLPILVGGESAGAHVSLSALLRLKDDEARAKRCVGVYLCYGIFDLGMTPSQRRWNDEIPGLSTPYLEWFYELALPGLDAEQRRDPALSPLFADLSCLPPLHLVVGELDPLLDDTLFLYQRLLAAGSETAMIAYPRAPHGFNGHPTAMAAHCNDSISAFIRRRVANA